VVIDFIDMVLESNRELVLRRLTECLGRDRTKHQVAEVTSLGLVQMTRKRVGEGLLEAFSETCPTCGGRGLLVHTEPVDERRPADDDDKSTRRRGRRGRAVEAEPVESALNEEQRRAAASAMATIAGLTAEAAELAAESTPEVPEALAEEPEPDHSPARPPADEAGAPAGSSSGPAPRRRRRAASRPAGPPVTADATAR
jgi:Ribonuclease G/E